MVEKIFMRQHFLGFQTAGLADTRTVPGSPQCPRVFARIALRSQAGFEDCYGLWVTNSQGNDDDLISLWNLDLALFATAHGDRHFTDGNALNRLISNKNSHSSQHF